MVSKAFAMSEPVLHAQGLAKTYQSGDRRIVVLRQVDLEVRAGETVSIRGESGAGKSTLLNLFAGLDTSDAGQLAWEGKPVVLAEATRRRAAFLGMVFQSFYLIPEIDAFQNVLMAARIRGVPGPRRRMFCCGASACRSGRRICRRSFLAASGNGWQWRGRS